MGPRTLGLCSVNETRRRGVAMRLACSFSIALRLRCCTSQHSDATSWPALLSHPHTLAKKSSLACELHHWFEASLPQFCGSAGCCAGGSSSCGGTAFSTSLSIAASDALLWRTWGQHVADNELNIRHPDSQSSTSEHLPSLMCWLMHDIRHSSHSSLGGKSSQQFCATLVTAWPQCLLK